MIDPSLLTLRVELLSRLAQAEGEYIAAHDEGVRLALSGADFAELRRQADATSSLGRVRDFLAVAVKRTNVAQERGAVTDAVTTAIGPADGPNWAPVREIAERHGCSAQHVRNKVHENQIIGLRVGKSLVVSVTSAAEFFERVRVGRCPTSEVPASFP